MKPAVNPRTEPGRVWDTRWSVFYNRLFKNSLRRHLGLQPSRIDTFARDQDTHSDKDELYLERSHQSRHTPPNLHQMTEKASPVLSQNGQEEAQDQPPETCKPARAATEKRTRGWQLQRLPPRTRSRCGEPATDQHGLEPVATPTSPRESYWPA